MSTSKTTPTWSGIKTKLANFDRVALLGLVQDLYAASKDNQTFLNARFAVGADVLKPYKATIERWLWPDLSKHLDTSIAKAKKAIADYKKAAGQTEGLAELMVFYCEQAIGFANDVGLDDDAYYDALVSMFEQALKIVATLPAAQRHSFLDRLDSVRRQDKNISGWVGSELNDLWPN